MATYTLETYGDGCDPELQALGDFARNQAKEVLDLLKKRDCKSLSELQQVLDEEKQLHIATYTGKSPKSRENTLFMPENLDSVLVIGYLVVSFIYCAYF